MPATPPIQGLDLPLIELPFADPDHPGFTIRIGVGGMRPGPAHIVKVDTGSTGIVIPAAVLHENGDPSLPLLPGVQQGGPAQITYQPSNNTLSGHYYTVGALRLGIGPVGDAAAIAENVVVLGADNAPSAVGMMGVGFGRKSALAMTNPFLQVIGMAEGGSYPSYLLTRTGIALALSPSDLADRFPDTRFAFQTLTYPAAGPAKTRNSWFWDSPSATMSVAQLPAQAGTMLLDTGLDLMLLELPWDGWTARLAGATISIAVPGGDGSSGPILEYAFQVGAGPRYQPAPHSSPMAPASVEPRRVGETVTAFVNTGINVLRGYMYYFDARVGQVGFAPYPD